MSAVNGVGEPCAGEPHARFDGGAGGNQHRSANAARSQAPLAYPTLTQMDSRSAFAAACRRSLTSASSRAARSMRSCCVCVRSCWLSTSSCWLSARACWRSARSVIALSSCAIASTVRVSSANWPATLAMSSRVVTFFRILRRRPYAASWHSALVREPAKGERAPQVGVELASASE